MGTMVQRVLYRRRKDPEALVNEVQNWVKTGYRLAGPIRTVVLPKFYWLGRYWGKAIQYEATWVKDEEV